MDKEKYKRQCVESWNSFYSNRKKKRDEVSTNISDFHLLLKKISEMIEVNNLTESILVSISMNNTIYLNDSINNNLIQLDLRSDFKGFVIKNRNIDSCNLIDIGLYDIDSGINKVKKLLIP